MNNKKYIIALAGLSLAMVMPNSVFAEAEDDDFNVEAMGNIEVDENAAYQNILKQYIQLQDGETQSHSNGGNVTQLPKESNIANYYGMPDMNSPIHYAYYDVNEDGIKELFLGVNINSEYCDIADGLDIWTTNGNECFFISSSYYRTDLKTCNGGVLREWGCSSAFENDCRFITFDLNGTIIEMGRYNQDQTDYGLENMFPSYIPVLTWNEVKGSQLSSETAEDNVFDEEEDISIEEWDRSNINETSLTPASEAYPSSFDLSSVYICQETGEILSFSEDLYDGHTAVLNFSADHMATGKVIYYLDMNTSSEGKILEHHHGADTEIGNVAVSDSMMTMNFYSETLHWVK